MGIVVAMIILTLTVLMCIQESKRRKIHFVLALAICIVATPLFGYIAISTFALRNPRGCAFCGNEKNEAVYCGRCGKNAEGEMITMS